MQTVLSDNQLQFQREKYQGSQLKEQGEYCLVASHSIGEETFRWLVIVIWRSLSASLGQQQKEYCHLVSHRSRVLMVHQRFTERTIIYLVIAIESTIRQQIIIQEIILSDGMLKYQRKYFQMVINSIRDSIMRQLIKVIEYYQMVGHSVTEITI